MILKRKKRVADKIWRENEPFIRRLFEYKLKSMPRYIDDCVQEVFSALMSAMQSDKDIENPRAWLTVVANNKIKDFYELNSREKDILVSLEEADKKGELIIGFEADFDADGISEEEIEEMKDLVISQLEPDERKLFKAYYADSKKVREIAEEFGLTESNVKQRLYRMRKNIVYLAKKALNRHYEQKNT